MPAAFTHDVFLSHSAKDKPVARDLAERLREAGLTVWFDEWEIRPGDSIPSKIEEGLENALIGLRAAVGLHICKAHAEELLGAPGKAGCDVGADGERVGFLRSESL